MTTRHFTKCVRASVPDLTFQGTLTWSNRILKRWYGRAYYEENPHRIRINRLLDSPDISTSTMRFVLWHDVLHMYLGGGHTKTFRDYKRLWLDWTKAQRKLDTLKKRFGIPYW